MADYKTIHGVNLRDYTTDPDTLIEGQVWYDKTNKVVQFFHNNVTSAGAWRLAGNVADDLANAVPLDHLDQSGPLVHQIQVPAQSQPQVARRS